MTECLAYLEGLPDLDSPDVVLQLVVRLDLPDLQHDNGIMNTVSIKNCLLV